GRIWVKAYGLIQKTYNPDRIKQPMKRTNPEKGQDVDPGWEPITWDEALDTLAERSGVSKAMLSQVEQGKVDLQRLITHRFPLDELQKAFDVMKEGVSLRSIVIP
ncbi:MAG: hypothetical protein IIC51_11690, partial [Planctomycetes bacterium]|nr:hypothetical protein [Planctomycetota bacterium]